MIIDAMDLLHSDTVSGFCIVSSDSDYTRLATRIREQGQFVMGVGRSETPKSFVNACEMFVYTENLVPQDKPKAVSQRPADDSDWTQTATKAIEMAIQDDGWASLGEVGQHVRQLDPAFDPRSFGHKQLSLLFKSRPDRFKTRESKTKNGPSKIYVRPDRMSTVPAGALSPLPRSPSPIFPLKHLPLAAPGALMKQSPVPGTPGTAPSPNWQPSERPLEPEHTAVLDTPAAPEHTRA